ncbi:MAG: efflux RND transporter periplasmic adaptor subunit [Acidobacteria bacterium]|nr:efflux RND transporter periplasmic adaptor subunit [Acidobacteriota bacterium]MCA1617401.1 efflux RND transporter periplasmic adaptor subunit [Acidobacteriota bacterium]
MSALRPTKLLAAGKPGESVKALAARHGPPEPRPSLRKDLTIRRQVQLGEVMWIVKDPREMAFYRFKEIQWRLIHLFDGSRTHSEILAEFNRRAGRNPVDLAMVLEWDELLRRMDLIELTAAERSLTLLDKFRTLREETAEAKSEGFNPFFIMFHVLDPDRILTRTVKYVRWIWSPPMVALTCIASLWTVGVFIRNWQPIWAGTMDLYHFFGKPLLDVLHFFFILSIIGAIHEFSHGYVCKMYGGEVHDIGLVLFYFTPAFYCSTSDSFMFPSRWQRLWVTVAGIYVEAIICSTATALWLLSYPDSFLHQFAYKTMLLTGFSTIFFNINPLIKIDGYYALSSVLQLQDLREASFKLLSTGFQKYVLRLPVEIPAMTRRKRRLCVVYGVLAAVYTASVMFVIGKLFNNLYTKYFPDIAAFLLMLTLFYLFRKRLRKAARIAKLFYLDKKEIVMSPRSRWPLIGSAVALVILLAVPWTARTIEATSVLKPRAQLTVQAPEESVVTDVFVREGDLVGKGQPIVRLGNPALEADASRFRSQEERFTKKSHADRAASNAGLAFQSGSRALAAQTARQTTEYRQGFLLVRSPIAGRVLSPRMQDLQGRSVPAGFALARIGDCRRMVAEAEVSERFLEYLKAGAPVKALIMTRPMESWPGSIASISPATVEQPLTAAAGIDPRLPSQKPDRFVALAVFENTDGMLLPGAHATLKIRSARASYASRMFDVLWRWLRTIVW